FSGEPGAQPAGSDRVHGRDAARDAGVVVPSALALRTRHTRAVLGWLALLSGPVVDLEAPHCRHEYPHRPWHLRRVSVQRGRDLPARPVRRWSWRARARLLRDVSSDHYPDPLGAAPGCAGRLAYVGRLPYPDEAL